ncbi:hypothetical protein QAD02_007154 [Eretmocerus hayati]|uniref:Uncharacterized protein n=1 Tax=Eretmocerus hayati TaxID=131215 RepID=A0ACC2N2W0_9HYME|nr:hypothetical protein QAD02_007154 [Eretmocerus hayati]
MLTSASNLDRRAEWDSRRAGCKAKLSDSRFHPWKDSIEELITATRDHPSSPTPPWVNNFSDEMNDAMNFRGRTLPEQVNGTVREYSAVRNRVVEIFPGEEVSSNGPVQPRHFQPGPVFPQVYIFPGESERSKWNSWLSRQKNRMKH